MKLKPEIIPMDKVILEMPSLLERKNEVLLFRNEALNKLKTIAKVMSENKELEKKADAHIIDSVKCFADEWTKAKEYYPEVRFGILQKIISFVATDNSSDDKKE